MKLRVGTSGFSYKQWKGPFYPEKHPDRELLSFYATKLSSVEINNTFYRSPNPELLARWASLVGEDFVFVLKAPQRITHRAKLADVEEQVELLWSASASLGEHRGPILFQLPPSFRKDLPRLERFLESLPAGLVPALEFRHVSWSDEEVQALLREFRAPLCVADTDGGEPAPILPTSGVGYLRLRRTTYGPAELQDWARRIREQAWDEVFVFFKHEDEGAAPRMALEFERAFRALA